MKPSLDKINDMLEQRDAFRDQFTEQLRDHLRQTLPDYMMPSALIIWKTRLLHQENKD